jgi:hypothetical protein
MLLLAGRLLSQQQTKCLTVAAPRVLLQLPHNTASSIAGSRAEKSNLKSNIIHHCTGVHAAAASYTAWHIRPWSMVV